MSDPRMRDEFEAFAGTHPILSQYGFDRFPVGGEEYDAIPLQGAWAAWQASRESLVISFAGPNPTTAILERIEASIEARQRRIDALKEKSADDGVEFGFESRSIVISQEAYSIFIAREAALKSKLAAAEQRVSELAELLRDVYKFPLEHACATGSWPAQELCERIDAALNPKPEAGSHAK